MVGEEPTPILPEEMEKLVKDLPRDPEIIDAVQEDQRGRAAAAALMFDGANRLCSKV